MGETDHVDRPEIPVTVGSKIGRAVSVSCGVAGIFLWPVIFAFGAMFRGFKPGGPVGGPSLIEWLIAGAILWSASYFYAIFPTMAWTRATRTIAAIVHVGIAWTLWLLISKTDGGFLFVPILLIAPISWLFSVPRHAPSNPRD